MTAIPFVRRTSNERVDGTLTVKIDIEPMYKLQFLTMFPDIGAPGALAAFIKVASLPDPEQKQRPGELCVMACTFCADKKFWHWIDSENGTQTINEEDAKEYILHVCGINSRKELDRNIEAAATFHQKIRIPFLEWNRSK
jgi:hypothetical protein